MNQVLREIRMAALEAPRVYFAPLVGAVKEMRRQMHLLARARRQPHTRGTDARDRSQAP